MVASTALAACAGGSPSRSTNTVGRQAPPYGQSGREGLGRGDGFDVAQRAGIAMWSRRSGEGYRLVIQRGTARAVAVAVQPAPFPFDVDLGTDRAGRTVAVYSRCAVAAARQDPAIAVRTRCSLYRLDVGTGVERRLDVAARPAVSQVRPAIDRGILAYAELPGDGERGRARVLLKRLGSATPPRAIASLAVRDPGDILGIDYEDERLAFAVFLPGDPAFTKLYLKEPGTQVRVVAAGGFGEENAQVVTSPSLAGRHLYWSYSNRHGYLDPNGFVVRRDLLTGQVTSDEVPGQLIAVAADAAAPSRALLIVSDRQAGYAPESFGTQRLRRVRRPAFEDPPARLGLRVSAGLEPSPD